MIVDIGYLFQSISQGNWILLLAIILSIGLSAAFSIIILKLLLDLTHVRIPSRFITDSPETVFEQVWMDYIFALTFLLRWIIRLFFMIVGFTGALLVCSVVLNWIADGKFIQVTGVPEQNLWVALGAIGTLPMVAALVISIDIQAKSQEKNR